MLLGATSVMAQNQPDTLTSQSVEKGREVAVVADKDLADKAYAEADYTRAAQLYEQLLQTQGESSVVYYNLGNSYFKTGDLARAILNYERALLLNPAGGDIRFNLELARSKTVDKITPLSELFFVTWAKDFANLSSSNGWARIAVGSFLLLILSLAAYIFGRKRSVRKAAFFLALLFLVVCVVANLSAGYQKNLRESGRSAIVMLPSVTVKSTPDQSGTDLFVLHEGCKVEIKDNSMREWKEIRLEDGNVGWLPANAIETI